MIYCTSGPTSTYRYWGLRGGVSNLLRCTRTSPGVLKRVISQVFTKNLSFTGKIPGAWPGHSWLTCWRLVISHLVIWNSPPRKLDWVVIRRTRCFAPRPPYHNSVLLPWRFVPYHQVTNALPFMESRLSVIRRTWCFAPRPPYHTQSRSHGRFAMSDLPLPQVFSPWRIRP